MLSRSISSRILPKFCNGWCIIRANSKPEWLASLEEEELAEPPQLPLPGPVLHPSSPRARDGGEWDGQRRVPFSASVALDLSI